MKIGMQRRIDKGFIKFVHKLTVLEHFRFHI